MAVGSGVKSVMGENVKAKSSYNSLDDLPKINGETIIGNVPLSTLGIAPAGYGDDSVWHIVASKSSTETLDSITITSQDKAGNTIDTYTITLPQDYIKNVVFNETTKLFTFTKKDNSTISITMEELFNKYVLKTTTIAGIDLQDDITARELEDAIKDQITILTNKSISADDNTITDLEVDNFKLTAISTSISSSASDLKLPTERAVKEYTDGFVKEGDFTKKVGTTGTLNITLTDNNNNELLNKDVVNVVFTGDTQTLSNKTIDNEINTIQQKSEIEADIDVNVLQDRELIYATDTNKLYIKLNGALQCINPSYEIKDKNSFIYQTITLQNETETLKYRVVANIGQLEVKYPSVFMTYAEYQALSTDEKNADVVYVVSDYPCPDITETREMVNNRWVIVRTPSTLPLLTFIYKQDIHNYHVYYTKPELNTLLDYKEDIINGAGSTIAHDDLTTNRVLVSDDNGKISASQCPSSLLENVANTFTPSYTLSTTAQQYVTNVNITGYMLNKERNRHQLDISMDVLNQVATWRSGGLMTITMPADYVVNYDATKPIGFHCIATRFKDASSYDWADVLIRYIDNNKLQLYLPQCELFTALGRITMTMTLF